MVFERCLMKTNAKKECWSISLQDAKHRSSKKRKKETNCSESSRAVKSFITSSSQKRRTERTPSFTTSMQPSISFQERDNASKVDLASLAILEAQVTDVNISSQIGGGEVSNGKVSDCLAPSHYHEVSAVAVHPSLLETIFSPVYQLFKAVGGEGSTSCTSTVEQVECPDDGNDSAETPATDLNSADCQESRRSILTPCSAVKASANASLESAGSMLRVLSAALSFSAEHQVSPSSKDGGAIVCQHTSTVSKNSAGKIDLDDGSPIQASDQSEEKMLGPNPTLSFLSIQHPESADCEFSETAGEMEEEDSDEFEDFDPYLFIKHLPDLSDVVSHCRPSLLLRQTRRCPPIALVLDLDETLVHSTLEHCDHVDFTFLVHFNCQKHTVYVRRRPHLQTFMERVAQLFEIIVFTASQGNYAEQLLNILDPKRKLIRHRVFRDSCVFVDGNYVKDLTILGRDLSKVVIVDNSPQAFGFQVDNGIPIESWFDDHTDDALLLLLPFLETLVGADDVRPIIADRYNLRKKIASTVQIPGMQAGKL
ncbi:hypothetical protein O6H91_05G061100 [Diphasiastrum complanatum]|uniref:Uncharacterized protein n=2 Tax=Diphasiastrum complanatum TaxID=34168 RepID=A0ACC2DP25_DIPCM|nr:hypothetical protein O6H91_05G061100 [Diphasiastrum complanatum]